MVTVTGESSDSGLFRILADVTTGGPLFPMAGAAVADSAGPSLVQAAPASIMGKQTRRRENCAEPGRSMRIFRTRVLKRLAGIGNPVMARVARHDRAVMPPYGFTMSISLMNPAYKTTTIVRGSRLRLAERSCALLEVERSTLTQMHRSRRRQPDAETDFCRHVGI